MSRAKEMTADRIVEAAYCLYVKGGLGAVSMRRTAKAVHITAPAIYKHFANKDALIEAIAERGFQLFERQLGVPKASVNSVAGIRWLLQAYNFFALAEPHLFEVMFVDPRVRLRRFPEDFASGRSNTFNLLRSFVDACIANGSLRRDDSLEITRDLWAFTHGYVGLYRAGQFGSDTAAFQRTFTSGLNRTLEGLAIPAAHPEHASSTRRPRSPRVKQ